MSRNGLIGFGEMVIEAPNGDIFIAPPADITITGEGETAEAQGGIRGVLQTTASKRSTVAYTLTANYQTMGWAELQLALGQKATVRTSETIPRHQDFVIPAGGNFAIAGMAADTDVKVATEGMEGYTFTAATGAPMVGEFQRGDGFLLFNEADVGKQAGAVISKTYADIETIGLDAEAATFSSELRVSFVLYTATQHKVYVLIPQATLTSLPSLAGTGEFSNTEMVFSLQQPSGMALPFAAYKLG